MIAESIYSVLVGISDLNTATNGNIFMSEAPENTTKPYAVFDFEDATPIKTLTGNSNLQAELWSVQLTGASYQALNDLRQAITARFTQERDLFIATLDDVTTERDRAADLDHITLTFRLHFY